MVYLILKLIHVAAVIIFMGNITVAIFWKNWAEKKKDREKLAFTFGGIIKADRIFTMPAVTLLIIGGVGAAMHGGFSLVETGWIFWSIILIIISAYAFMSRLVPIQKKIYALTNDEEKFTWEKYEELAKAWNRWDWVAVVTPYIALILMVLKI